MRLKNKVRSAPEIKFKNLPFQARRHRLHSQRREGRVTLARPQDSHSRRKFILLIRIKAGTGRIIIGPGRAGFGLSKSSTPGLFSGLV